LIRSETARLGAGAFALALDISFGAQDVLFYGWTYGSGTGSSVLVRCLGPQPIL